MFDLIAHNLAPIMFVGLFVFLLIGFPVAFSLGACGLVFATIGDGVSTGGEDGVLLQHGHTGVWALLSAALAAAAVTGRWQRTSAVLALAALLLYLTFLAALLTQ